VCSLVVIELFKNVSIFSPQTLYLNNYYTIRSNIIVDAKRGIYKLIFRFLENIIKLLLSYLRLKFTFFGVFRAGRLGGLADSVVKHVIIFNKKTFFNSKWTDILKDLHAELDTLVKKI
jgi:hypothetical protein